MSVQTAPGKIFVLKEERAWLDRHATHRGNQWYCKETDTPIEMVMAHHTLWASGGPGPCAGSGETVGVYHLFCPACGPRPEFTQGSPIDDSDLIEVANG